MILLNTLLYCIVAVLSGCDFEREHSGFIGFLEVSALQEREKGVFYRSSASS